MEQPALGWLVPTRGQAVSHSPWLQPGPLGAQMEMVIRRNPTRGGSQSKDRHHPNSFYGPCIRNRAWENKGSGARGLVPAQGARPLGHQPSNLLAWIGSGRGRVGGEHSGRPSVSQVPPFPLTPLAAGNELLAAKALRGGQVTSHVAQEQGLDGTGPVMPASALTSRDGDSGVTLCGESATLALLGEVGLQNPYSLHLPLLSPLPPPSTGPWVVAGRGVRVMKWGKSITHPWSTEPGVHRGAHSPGVHTHTSHAQRNECLSMHEHIHTCTARLNTYMHPAPTTYSWVHADTPTGPTHTTAGWRAHTACLHIPAPTLPLLPGLCS